MKFCAKIMSFIFGVIIGIVLVIGGIGLGGYVALTKEGMVGMISDQVAGFNPKDEAKKLSLLEYGTQVIDALKNYQSSTIATLEDAVGIDISTQVAGFVGIDAEIIRNSSLSNLSQNIVNGYTIEGASNKFGFAFPDMPLFNDDEFLNKPLIEGFNYLSSQLVLNDLRVIDLSERFGLQITGQPFDNELIKYSKINELPLALKSLMLGEFTQINTTAHIDAYQLENAYDFTNWASENLNGTPVAFDYETMALGASVGSFNYFAPIVGENAKTAQQIQAEYISAYNANEANTVKIFDRILWMRSNYDDYNAYKAYANLDNEDNAKIFERWAKNTARKWIENGEYLIEPENADELYAQFVAIDGNADKTKDQWLSYYWETVKYNEYKAISGNESKSKDDYYNYLFDNQYSKWLLIEDADNNLINAGKSKNDWLFSTYLPNASEFAPLCMPNLFESEVVYNENAPKLSNKVLVNLADTTLSTLNERMNSLTLADTIDIDDTAHFLIKEVKNSQLNNIANDLTDAINNAVFKDLMNIVTDDDVAKWNATHTNDLTNWKAGKTAYDDLNPTATFDYFNNKEEQLLWIEAKANLAVPEIWYDEWVWKSEHIHYFDYEGTFNKNTDGKEIEWSAKYIASTPTYSNDLTNYLNANSGKTEYDYIMIKYIESYNNFVAIAGNADKNEYQWLKEVYDINASHGGRKNAWSRAYIASNPNYNRDLSAYLAGHSGTEADYLQSQYDALYNAYIAPSGETKTIDLWLANDFDLDLIAPTNRFAKPIAPTETLSSAPIASSRILQALAYSSTTTLNDTVENLYVKDIYEESSVGVMALISPFTKLNDLPNSIGDLVNNTSIIEMLEKEVLKYDGHSWSELDEASKTNLRNAFGNMTIPQMLAAYLAATVIP